MGYRTAAAVLRQEGWDVNNKRVHRIWKKEGLKVPARRPKKRRRGGRGRSAKLRAQRMNHVWSYDFIFDQTDDGGRLKWLNLVDEYTREALAIEVGRSLTAAEVVAVLERVVSERGMPEFIRSDNGPEFVAGAVKEWIARRGFLTSFIDPGSPWQNPFVESFNSRFRDEFLNVEVFGSLVEARFLGEEHRHKHNQRRPHSSLGGLTPAQFASRCPHLPRLPTP